MSGPIVRSGPSPAFTKNWESVFGKASGNGKKKSVAKAPAKSAKKSLAKAKKK